MPVELFQDLLPLLVEVSVLCGLLGAMVYMFLRALCIEIFEAIEGTEWYMDWEDRVHVRVQNAMDAKRARQSGKISVGVALAVVAVLVVVLSACAAPEPALSGSDQWWSQVKRGW